MSKKPFLSKNSIIILVITTLLAGLSATLLVFFISFNNKLNKTEEDRTYQRYYVMIAGDDESSFTDSLYESVRARAEEEDAYVEMISKSLSQKYSDKELVKIAVASKVDGIILYADESSELRDLIDEAYKENIPVVTLFNDYNLSKRLSFVGISNYNLGKEYGKLIIEMLDEITFKNNTVKISVLVDANTEDPGQNVLYTAISETLEKDYLNHSFSHKPAEVSVYPVDSTNSFSVEESVRNLLMDQENGLPDIVVCLNEIETTSMYQAVVDYNEVGRVNILGFYDSASILKGIGRNVIYATISVDIDEIGTACIDALTEYYELGNTSEYSTADITVVTKESLDLYKEGDGDEN
ncbi:MAG: substrate-binding domain-containing protein [Lachnospiraceae bacterium]|nr:substrate-binding domain-containing protein [Lachnospiraceae bacterium]